MTETLNQIVARFPRRPAAYFFLLITWVTTLWFLSAKSSGPDTGPQITHIDKAYHFCYFLAGGILLTMVIKLQWQKISHLLLFSTVLIIGSIIGRLDEYHQTFTPGRSGNDTGDWLADTLGTAAGCALIIFLILPRLAQISSNRAKAAENSIKVRN
ncbi:MAG: VanZ family protein [Akkermansiaceae bacterium]